MFNSCNKKKKSQFSDPINPSKPCTIPVMESGKIDYSFLPKEKFRGDDYLCQWNGFWFRQPFLEAAHQVLNHYKPLPTDTVLASYPKTGTTWLKALLYSIINRSSRDSILTNHPHMLVPTLEIQLYGPKTGSFDSFAGTANSSARILATHLPYQVISGTINSTDCRVVYITRNPKDTLVSSWHFYPKSKEVKDPWSLEDAVEKFCNGVGNCGPYYDHVLGYWKESLERPHKVFFITYEELKSDTKTHVKRLAEFLGCPFDGDGKEEDVLDEIVSSCSFEKMSNYEANKSDDGHMGWLKFPLSSFFRQGGTGDHKNYLTPEMINRVDKITAEKFHGSGFMYGI